MMSCMIKINMDYACRINKNCFHRTTIESILASLLNCLGLKVIVSYLKSLIKLKLFYYELVSKKFEGNNVSNFCS